jgi:hypothetical protein
MQVSLSGQELVLISRIDVSSDDHEIIISDLPCTYDSDVAGPDTTLNNDSMNNDVDVSNPPCTCDSEAGAGATLKNDFMNVDVDVPSAHESIQHLSRSSSQAVNSPVALSHLFSTIQYANKPNTTLCVLLASNLSTGECAEYADLLLMEPRYHIKLEGSVKGPCRLRSLPRYVTAIIYGLGLKRMAHFFEEA